MSEADQDLDLVKQLWFIRGGKIIIRMNGADIVSIISKGAEPQIDILNMDSLIELISARTPFLMDRMRRLSRKMAVSGLNIRVTVNGDPFLNIGKEGSALKDLEGFANMLVKRLNQVKFKRKSR